MITNNTISGNESFNSGAGIYCGGASSPQIADNIITGNTGYWGGGILVYDGCSAVITGNIISGNTAGGQGGGISCYYSAPTITGNRITENEAAERGGGISCDYESIPAIVGNIITGNAANEGGGIDFSYYSNPEITANLIAGNSAQRGGGISSGWATAPWIINCTVAENTATDFGGGIYCYDVAAPTVLNTILWQNAAPYGPEISILHEYYYYASTFTISYSDVEGGKAAVYVEEGSLLNWGDGMIDADPLFVSGSYGDFYLSQIASGQSENSPCVDAGDPESEMIEGTTRSDCVQDAGVVDMGHHYPLTAFRVVTGPGAADENPPIVRVFPCEEDAVHEYEFEAYVPDHYGVNVTCGDVDGDHLEEILTGAGPGPIFGPHVRGFTADGTPLPGLSYLAYGTHKWGVNVAAGDIDADGFDEIITGAGAGAVFGPHVRGWNYDGIGTVTLIPGVSYFAYGTPMWGVNVAAGDIDGDGYDEIVTGAGPGAVYGPHVRGWNVDGGTAASMPDCSFLAYGTHRYGVNISCGDVDGDGIDEIVTAPGPAPVFGAHVRGFEMDGTPLPGCSFFAWPPSQVLYGARVFAGADLDGDGRDELVVGAGPDPNMDSPVRVFRYDGAAAALWFSLTGYPPELTQGVNVAGGRF